MRGPFGYNRRPRTPCRLVGASLRSPSKGSGMWPSPLFGESGMRCAKDTRRAARPRAGNLELTIVRQRVGTFHDILRAGAFHEPRPLVVVGREDGQADNGRTAPFGRIAALLAPKVPFRISNIVRLAEFHSVARRTEVAPDAQHIHDCTLGCGVLRGFGRTRVSGGVKRKHRQKKTDTKG